MMYDDDPITLRILDRVAIVTLNRPDTRNSFSVEMSSAFAEIFAALRDNPDLSAVVLTGVPGTFSAGDDMELLATPSSDVRHHVGNGTAMHEWFRAYLNIPVPVIAAVDGPAFGGGFGLALGADIVLASSRAKFSTVFSRIGLIAGLGSSWLLPRIVGLNAARDLLLTGRVFDAEEAKNLGIVQSVHDPQELQSTALDLADRFSMASRDALAGTKTLLRLALDQPFETTTAKEIDLQARALSSTLHHEAARQLIETSRTQFDWDRAAKERS